MLKRLFIYFKETPKIWNFILISIIVGVAIQLAMGTIFSVNDTAFNVNYIIGMVTYFLILAFWRVTDELKDAKTDLEVFPERPVPSGKVKLSDLRVAAVAILFILFALNMILWDVAIGFFLFLLFYAFLMSKWFFLEGLIGNNRLLAFVTHAPTVLMSTYYITIIFNDTHDLPLFNWQSLILTFWVCTPMFAQDFARKTYAPSMEIEGYQTYSAMIGYKFSSLIALFFAVVSYVLSVYLHLHHPFHMLFIISTSILFGVYLLITLAFILNPEKFAQALVTYATIQVVLIYLALIVSSII